MSDNDNQLELDAMRFNLIKGLIEDDDYANVLDIDDILSITSQMGVENTIFVEPFHLTIDYVAKVAYGKLVWTEGEGSIGKHRVFPLSIRCINEEKLQELRTLMERPIKFR